MIPALIAKGRPGLNNPTSLEGNFFCARTTIWCDHKIRFRVLGFDFCLKARQVGVLWVLSKEHSGVQRYVDIYANEIKGALARGTMVVGAL